nr:ComEC/Rec2 family competence protein [Nocardioides thalensis]
MPVLAAAAWAGGLLAYRTGPAAGWLAVALLAVAAVSGSAVRRSATAAARERWLLLTGALLAAAAVAGSVGLRHGSVEASPLRAWAEERAWAEVEATVVSDPRPVAGPWGDQVVLRLKVHAASARGASYEVGGTLVLLGGSEWSTAALGERVRTAGRLAPADDPDVAALVTGARAPVRTRGPDVWWRASGAVRASIRDAVDHRPPAEAGLVPALVDGDDAALPEEVEADFRTTGLTHLTAVSGTNLTLVVGFVLLVARWLGARRRWLVVIGLLGIAGFVLLARTEPSVVRAAAMGVVGLFALGRDGRRRGLRALGAAVICLLLVQPALAVSPGFALSVLATGGIVLLAPALVRAMSPRLSRPLAEAIAVPVAAQLACTPLVAALSGEVSLVAVAANLLVAPAVGPATVLGLAAGLVGLVWPWAGTLLGTAAGWCVAWLVLVARHGADLPGASIGWGAGAGALALLTCLCLAVAVALPGLLRRRWLGAGLAVVLLVVVLGVPGRVATNWSGWPPDGWLLVACDVGQGDALVLSAGEGTAVVVDAGPDPAAVDRCLDALGVSEVPLVLLTHFHADHVGGLRGVLGGRRVGTIEASPVLDPPANVDDVESAARAAGVPLAAAPYASTRRYGDLVLQVLWPDLPRPVPGAGDGSSANDASVVVLAESQGVRILLTGDVEPPGQARLAAALPELDVDVLKVPHHGSAYQDDDWLLSLDAELAVVSVGADNDYGHPDPGLLGRLTTAGAVVGRTDTDGDLAVVAGPDGPELVSR